MSTSTTRLNATKPASSENVSVTILNSNFDLFDAAVGSSIGTSAARPASAFSGRLWYSTDSAKLYVNSAASASAAASWQDAVANALTGAVTIGGDLTMSAGSVNTTRSASSSNTSTSKVTGDSQSRYAVLADGKTQWGSGTATADTNLYRSAADTLKTDDSLVVGAGLTAVGTVTASTTMNVGGALSANGGLTVVGKGSVEYLKKSISTGRISTTTFANDPHLTFNLSASATYMLRVFLSVSGATAGDFKTAYAFTGAASGGTHPGRWSRGPALTTTGAGDTTTRSSHTTWAGTQTYGLDGATESAVVEEGILDTTAGSGTITLQWAQNSSTATSTIVTSDSFAILQRLA